MFIQKTKKKEKNEPTTSTKNNIKRYSHTHIHTKTDRSLDSMTGHD